MRTPVDLDLKLDVLKWDCTEAEQCTAVHGGSRKTYLNHLKNISVSLSVQCIQSISPASSRHQTALFKVFVSVCAVFKATRLH